MNYTPSLAIQIVVSIVFVVLLAIPIALDLKSKPMPRQIGSTQAKKSSIELFGFFLEEVGEAANVIFTHEPPELDPQLEHILPQIASVGASVSVCDFDNDGWNDFYLTTSRTGASNALYKNLADGTFENVAKSMNLADVNLQGTGVSMGAVWADADNDGFEDVFIYKWGRPEIYLNRGGKIFERAGQEVGLPDWINANSAVWFDYNNDGHIDLLIGGYYKEEIDLWNLENTLIMPESFEYANNGGRNYLLENTGNGAFNDVTISNGITSTRWTLALGAWDCNDDGYQDVFIANDYSVDELFINNYGTGFIEVGKGSNIGYAPKSGMNVSLSDVNNNGRFSIYVSNITEMGILLQGNNLWQPFTSSGEVAFRNNAGALGVELGGWSYGSQFGDLDNDGFQDLYLANGFISAARNNSYWYDYSKITGGNKSIISDAANWPAMEGRSQSGYQYNKVWMNQQGGVFADVTAYVSDLPPFDSRAVAMVDLWNRGVLDVIVANQNGPVSVLKNHMESRNNWLSVQLVGTSGNSSAIGAKVTLYWEKQTQSQIVSGGIGFSSQNQRRLHFGIGKSNMVDKLIIVWPSGWTQEVNSPEINMTHQITERDENS